MPILSQEYLTLIAAFARSLRSTGSRGLRATSLYAILILHTPAQKGCVKCGPFTDLLNPGALDARWVSTLWRKDQSFAPFPASTANMVPLQSPHCRDVRTSLPGSFKEI